jgi:acyl-CoA reductase-like NAD-dependent aldehyde dehydrogenase
MLHIPILRGGEPYTSLETLEVPHFRTREPLVRVSQANPGLIAKDLAGSKRVLQELSPDELLTICKRAAHAFMEDDLPLGEVLQSPREYVQQLSATTGIPHTLCKQNMRKIEAVLINMEAVLSGLTRGLDLEDLRSDWCSNSKSKLSFAPQTSVLGAILPNNSPGVHALWLPAIPLQVNLAIKAGRAEPWTPFRIVQAFLSAGCPREAFGFYPADYSGAAEILRRCGRSILFGDQSTVREWAHDKRIQIHGPGWSKILLGQDQANRWSEFLDVMEHSIVSNGGRSCINASGVWVDSNGREVAEALASRLATIEALPMDNPAARIAAFTDPNVAERISGMIDDHLKTPGAEDVTARLRGAGRLVKTGGCTFLLPTVIRCDDPGHPLANSEFLFPFCSVVEVPQEDMLQQIGHSLVVSAITEDREFIRELLRSQHIDRLNLGPIPTNHISWDQPHEGNLFEHLYQQRAFQSVIEEPISATQ